MMINKLLEDGLCITVSGMSPNICLPFISKKVLDKDSIQVFLLSMEYSPLIRGSWDIEWVKDILEILCTSSSHKLKMPSGPVAFVIQRLELSWVTPNRLPVFS
jgi:hypothetical protein